MGMHGRHKASLIEEAEEWERALASGGPAERLAFAAWIRRSPEHLQAYLHYVAVETEVQGLDPARAFDLDELLAQSWGNVVPLSREVSHRDASRFDATAIRLRRYGLLVALAGAAALAILVLRPWSAKTTIEWADYITATGEQRRIALPDGSIVELNTQSHIRVAYRPKTREVELVSGEAVFNVQHNVNRPFRVHAQTSVVEDMATQFAVYIRPDASTTVSVLDGRVQLSRQSAIGPSPSSATVTAGDQERLTKPVQVAAGEQIFINAAGTLVRRAALNVNEAASWRQHRLWFENASLEQIAAEFNRYNIRKIQIVADPILDQKRFTATWDPYDPDSFIQYLHQSDPALVVETAGNLTVVGAHK